MNTDLIVALLTLAGTLAVLIWNVIDRRGSAFDAQMGQATDFLTGHTQRRSAGIAIVEGARTRLAGRETTWRTAIIGLLCTQAVYLLEWSEQGNRPDEVLNLKRILELLAAFSSQPSRRPEITEVARRVKLDLDASRQRQRRLDRAEVQTMIGNSAVITDWITQLPASNTQP